MSVVARRAREVELHRSGRELQAARAEAEAAEARLDAMLDGLPLALLVFRPDGTLRHANEAGRRYGHARPGDALVSAAIRELVTTALQAVAPPIPLSRRLELAGPPARTIDLAVAQLGDGSGDVLTVVEDITERRRLEEMRRDFVANISHELRTPIGALSLLAETLSEEDDPDVVGRLAGRLHREALRLGRTVDDLLLLSRIEGGEVATEPLTAAEIVAEAVDRTAVNARERQIEVKVDGDGSLGGHLVGNRVQLVSALANLIDNALTYSDPGSVVLVSAAEAAGPPGAGRRRPRHRHPRPGPRADLRTLLPGGPGAQPPHRRYRPGPGDRPPRCDQPRRRGPRHVTGGRGLHVRAAPAARPARLIRNF